MTDSNKTTFHPPPPQGRPALKRFVFAVAETMAWIALSPLFFCWKTGLFRYLTFATMLCIIPSNMGIILRRVWYRQTLKKCGRHLVVEFLGWIRTDQTEVGDNVYIGVNSWVGLANIGSDVMVSGAVKIISGLRQHNMESAESPMKQAGGTDTRVRIGSDVWIGVGAIVGADVADGCVVGAGSVVTRATEPGDVVAGSPAQRIRNRFADQGKS